MRATADQSFPVYTENSAEETAAFTGYLLKVLIPQDGPGLPFLSEPSRIQGWAQSRFAVVNVRKFILSLLLIVLFSVQSVNLLVFTLVQPEKK